MHRMMIVLLLVVGLIAAACGSATESTTTTGPGPDSNEMVGADGVATDISDTSRIVSLNGDLTETIFALGAGDRVVGRDLTTTYPPEATSLPAVGLGRRLVAEEVIALSPTLVIGDTQIEPESSIEQIREAGIPVLILNAEVTLPGVIRKINTVAEILDLPAEGTELAREVQAEIDDALALAATATTTPRAAYVYVRGPETLLMFGVGMPTSFMIDAAAAVDVLSEAGVLFAQPLNAESLVETNPEVLITPTEGYDIIGGMDSFLALPGVSDTQAGQDRAVLTFDEALLLGMGPRTGQALLDLVIALHPEVEAP